MVCGLLGSFFIYVNVSLAMIRKRYITTNFRKITEAICFAIFTSCLFFGVCLLRRNECRSYAPGAVQEGVRFRCEEG